MILPTVQQAEIEELFGDDMDQVEMPSGCVYIRTTTNYKWVQINFFFWLFYKNVLNFLNIKVFKVYPT